MYPRLGVCGMMNSVLLHDMEDIYSRNVNWKCLDGKTIMLTGAYGMIASYITYFVIYLQKVKNINIKLVAVVRSKDKYYQKINWGDECDEVLER